MVLLCSLEVISSVKEQRISGFECNDSVRSASYNSVCFGTCITVVSANSIVGDNDVRFQILCCVHCYFEERRCSETYEVIGKRLHKYNLTQLHVWMYGSSLLKFDLVLNWLFPKIYQLFEIHSLSISPAAIHVQ